MKIVAIGAGNWGRNLIRTLHEIGVLGAIVEPNESLREAMLKSYPQVPLFSSVTEVSAKDFGAAVIATPVSTHFDVASSALNLGLDVFVEKPMTLTLEQATALNSLADEQNRILMVGHLLMYSPAVEEIKKILVSGRIGKLMSIHQTRLNLGKARNRENVLWSLGVHDIAVLLQLTGEAPSEVSAHGQCFLQSSIEDETFLHFKFPSGIHAHLHNSWLWHTKERNMTVIGSKGMIQYDELEHKVWLHKKSIDPELSNHDDGKELIFDGVGPELLKLEMNHFIHCLTNRARPSSDGLNGVMVTEVLSKATEQLRPA